MSSNLTSANNISVTNNITCGGNIISSGNIQTTNTITGQTITATNTLNALNLNITGQLNSLNLQNLNSLDTTTSISTSLNNLTNTLSQIQNTLTSLQNNLNVFNGVFTDLSGNLGVFNTNPQYKFDVSANSFRIGGLIQENSNGSLALINQNCNSDPENFCLYQGPNGDSVLNSALGQNLEFKIHNNQIGLMNTTGLGIFNGAPNYQIDCSGIINSSVDLMIGGNSLNNQLQNLQTKTAPISFNNNNLIINDISGSNIQFQINGNESLIIENGKIGINNTSPNYSLDVSGNINASNDILISGTSLSNELTQLNKLTNSLSYSTNNNLIINDVSGSAIQFEIGGNEYFCITPNKIGINNNNPIYNVDCVGTINASSDIYINQSSISTSLSNCAKKNTTNTFTANQTFNNGLTASSILLGTQDLNNRLTTDETDISGNTYNISQLQTKFNNLFTIKACGFWSGSQGGDINTCPPNTVLSSVYATYDGIQGTNIVLDASISPIGIVIATPTSVGYTCKANILQTTTPFSFIVDSMGGGSSPDNLDNPFFWIVI